MVNLYIRSYIILENNRHDYNESELHSQQLLHSQIKITLVQLKN